MNINWQLRELNIKIVYYGAALSGKTTNIEQIHSRVNPNHRSELVSLKTREDRTLFFDFMQLELGKIGGLTPKLHLYTVPGQSYYEASRKLVLRGVDGIVFVVDSAKPRVIYNCDAWMDMHTQLYSMRIDPHQIPTVVQFNKQDLINALPSSFLKSRMKINGLPCIEASAINGQGVLDTLKLITRGVMAQMQREPA